MYMAERKAMPYTLLCLEIAEIRKRIILKSLIHRLEMIWKKQEKELWLEPATYQGRNIWWRLKYDH